MDDATELDAFAAHWRLLGHSPETLYNYLGVIKRLPRIDCTATDLAAYLGMRAETVSAATLTVDVRALRAFYGWRSEQRDCPNPAAKLKTPKVSEAPVRSLDEAGYRKIITTIAKRPTRDPRRQAVNARDRAILALLWATGARASEVARLEVTDLDLAEQLVVIRKAKNGKPRTVGLTNEAAKELRAYLKVRDRLGGGPFLFLGTSSRSIGGLTSNGLQQAVRKRAEAAGVKASAHDFRRSLAERWLAAGGSEALLRAHAGWQSPAMVARYVRSNAEKLAVVEHRRLLG